MMRYWELVRSKVDALALRERISIFLALAFVLYALLDMQLLDPLLAKQKTLLQQVTQQQEKMKELQAQMQDQIQAIRDDKNSPLRTRLAQLKQQLQEQEGYLQSRRDRLVEPDKMAGLLEQVLNKNDKLRLVKLETLPLSLLVEKPVAPQSPTANVSAGNKQPNQQVFKHGIQITVSGAYLDILRYLAALEKLPVQMFWGEINMSVEKYPDSVLTLTIYTLSMEQTWLAV